MPGRSPCQSLRPFGAWSYGLLIGRDRLTFPNRKRLRNPCQPTPEATAPMERQQGHEKERGQAEGPDQRPER